MSKITDEVVIDAKALYQMRWRIKMLERDNVKSNEKLPSRMVKDIENIIEEEADQACL
jgi:hypothetical protein